MDATYERLANLDGFIAYCEATKAGDWAVDVVRTKNGANCLFGHLVNWFYGPEYDGNVSGAWDYFESAWATEYMVYPVNDGRKPKYQQATAKDRCVAYLKDLASGEAETTGQIMDRMSATETA